MMHQFGFKYPPEAFHRSIIIAITFTAHWNDLPNCCIDSGNHAHSIGHLDLSEQLALYPYVYLQLHEIMPV